MKGGGGGREGEIKRDRVEGRERGGRDKEIGGRVERGRRS